MGAEVLVTHKAGTGKDDALDVGFVHHGSRGVDKRLNRGWLRVFDGGGHAINNGGGAEGVVGVDIDYETLGTDNGMLMVTASGTAVRFSPVS